MDAISAAVELGAKRAAIERKAIALALQFPRATNDEALRLLFGSE